MKDKSLKTIFMIAIVCVVGYNVYQSQEEVSLSALNLANIEALARSEGGGGYFVSSSSTVVDSKETPISTIITTAITTNCIPGGRNNCTSGVTYVTTTIPKS